MQTRKTVMSSIPTDQELKDLNKKLKEGLTTQWPEAKIPNIAMPRCADLYLSIIDNSNTTEPDPDEIAVLFEEYFTRVKHVIFKSKQVKKQTVYVDEI